MDKQPENNVSTIQKVRSKVYSRLSSFFEMDSGAKNMLDSISTSKDITFSQIYRSETRHFDEKWIDEIERGVSAIETIIKDPKKFIKTERSLVPVELAKKTGAESVIHLASHSQYVKDVDKNGNIMPKKILNLSSEDDYEIYENRFIKTLVDKLVIFMETRYDYMIKNALTSDSDFLKIISKVKINDITYEYESKLKLSTPSKDEGNRETNEALMRKISLLRRRIQFISQSSFMENLKNCKPVKGNISMTNIIIKNIYYNQAYKLYKFLDEYDRFGIRITVKEETKEFTDEYKDELMCFLMASFLSIDTEKVSLKAKPDKERKYVVKPRIVKRVEDEMISDNKFDISDPQYASYLSPEQKALLRKMEQEKAKKAALQAKKERLALKQLQEKERKRLMELKEKQRKKILQEKIKEQERLKKEQAKLKAQKEREAKAKQKALLKQKEKEKELLRKERERIRKEALKEKERENLKKQKQKEQAKIKKAKQKEQEKAKKAKAQQVAKLKKQKEEEKLKKLEEEKRVNEAKAQEALLQAQRISEEKRKAKLIKEKELEQKRKEDVRKRVEEQLEKIKN